MYRSYRAFYHALDMGKSYFVQANAGKSSFVRNLHIGFIGAPFNEGQPKKGVELGPQTIRDTGVLNRLKSFGHNVKDFGDVIPDQNASGRGPDGEKNFNSVLSYSHKLSQAVSSVIEDGRICVTLGGDHSIGIGTVQGHAQATPNKQVVLLWVDAHADINSGSSSGSGNMHGMSVSHSLHEMSESINKIHNGEWPVPCMSAPHVAYIGLRDIDSEEQKILDQLNVLYFTSKDIDKLGIPEVIARCLDSLNPGPDRPLHVSFDIDVLDPTIAPSTGTPVPGGLTLREGMMVLESSMETGHLSAIDLVEVNPTLSTLPNARITAKSAKHLLLAGLAKHRGT